jgi:hypothetical protein
MMPREQFGRRTLAGPSVTRKTHGSAYFGAIKTRREVAGIVSAARYTILSGRRGDRSHKIAIIAIAILLIVI